MSYLRAPSQKKVAFILSAMRHFADTLREQGISVDYVHSMIQRIVEILLVRWYALSNGMMLRLVVTAPGEFRVGRHQDWETDLGIVVEIRRTIAFFARAKCSKAGLPAANSCVWIFLPGDASAS